MRFRGIWVLATAGFFGAFAHAQTDPTHLDILSQRPHGIYLSAPSEPGAVTSALPLLPLDPAALSPLFEARPELRDHKVVIVLPSLLRGKETVTAIKHALRALDLPDDVELIRWPDGSLTESLLDFLPRRQDLQKPLPDEIRAGHGIVFGGEALAVSLFTYLAWVGKISPEMAVAASALDLAQLAVLTYPLRSIAAYTNRQSTPRQFLVNFLIGAVCTTNFFLLYHHGDLAAAMSTFIPEVTVGSIGSMLWSNTSVAVYRWEFSDKNTLTLDERRVFRSRLFFALQLILSPFYVYSISPWAETLFSVPYLDVNLGHLVIYGTGIVGTASWPFIDGIAERTSKWLKRHCNWLLKSRP